MLLQKKEQTISRVVLIEARAIHRNPAQPRKVFAEDKLRILAHSIQQNGLLQPVSVRKDQFGRYELISGERRLRACVMAGIQLVPCIILVRSEEESAVLALIENLHREDLNLFEQAKALQALLCEWQLTQEQAASRLGMAQSTLANKLRLLRLTEAEQSMIIQHHLSERHARALLKLQDPLKRELALQTVVRLGLNVTQTEELVSDRTAPPKRQEHPPIIKDVRVFVNSINKAIQAMKASGIEATSKRREDDEVIEYVVRIPRVQKGVSRET